MPDDVRLANYLARIGFGETPKPDLATLNALHVAHVDAIPFEGLDPVLGRPVDLDLDAVQAKLVEERRGGYCFEQNGLFKAVLEAIGFKVTGLGARVCWMSPPESPLGPRTHMIIKVDLAEGPYLADVAFGGCLLDRPLRLETDVEQRTGMGTYRLTEADGLFFVSAKQPAGWRTMYAFDLAPQIRSDYDIGSWYAATHRQSPFSKILIMERLGPNRRYKLVNRRFTVEARDGEVISERDIESADDMSRVLDDTFNLCPPIPIEQIFEKIDG